ncbi:GGDEF domain-containing protein [Acidaminobacter sp. JC074]|uniref:GGDEF domain-containing protein n=1 Tax=Acidaminobacter sp. JC074 TaxID=2530199 RepID=UPI001F0DB76F|nr:GGDEF domain-containing protein [Acidaminobacter sp. JC074]MCH4888680.1 GGDEF domain-containing protein [Acidaminobacter sp. JC074]
MVTQIVQLELFILIIMLSTIVMVGAYFKKEKDVLQRILVNSSIFLFMIILSNSIKTIDSGLYWQLSYFLFAVITFIIIQTPVTSLGLIIVNLVISIIIAFIPVEEIIAINLTFILLIVNTALYLLMISQFRKSQPRLVNLIGILAIGIITSYFLDPIYHMSLMTIVISFIAWYVLDQVITENIKYDEALQDKLKKLENEFNYELRKEVNKHTFHLKEVQEKMSHINKIDNLTKAYNKKAIFNIVEELTLDRRVEKFTIIMFDLDKFKNLNDTLGHVQGDLCLKSLAAIARESIRDSDSLGRYGGDEFLIVLPKASLSTAVSIAERFRKKIDTETQPHFTISCGLASYPEDGKTLKELLDIADKGLYRSKEKGRNAVSYDNPNNDKKY